MLFGFLRATKIGSDFCLLRGKGLCVREGGKCLFLIQLLYACEALNGCDNAAIDLEEEVLYGKRKIRLLWFLTNKKSIL